ncbi:MAG: HAD-IA family hydrolase [Candidatus Aenigmarchaeota archaeon]|nr:HAD-IA family hydrolase [Candidatus Aenigmarchaeota archaeon]
MPSIRAIIFDFDGTFAPQTNRLHFLSFARAFERAGYKLTERELAPLMGVPQDEIVRTLLPSSDEQEVRDISAHKSAEYKKLIEHERIPKANIRTAETLKKRGFKVAISSGSYRWAITKLLPAHLMNDLITAESVHRPKPDPEILLKTAHDIHVHPEHCVYVGDSWRDCEAARRADMFFVGVLADLTADELVLAEPDMIIDRVSELLKIFKKAPQEVDS